MKRNKSDVPLTNNGVSFTIWLYVIHIEDETMFIALNNRE